MHWKEQASLQCSVLFCFPKEGNMFLAHPLLTLHTTTSWCYCQDRYTAPYVPGRAQCSAASPLELGLLLWMWSFWRKFSEHQFPLMTFPFIWRHWTITYWQLSVSQLLRYSDLPAGTPQLGRGCCIFSSGKKSLQVWEGNRKSSWG